MRWRRAAFNGLYWKYIRDLSRKAKVIYDLLKAPLGANSDCKKHSKRKQSKRDIGQVSSKTGNKDKRTPANPRLLTQGKIMAYPDFSKPLFSIPMLRVTDWMQFFIRNGMMVL